MDIPPKYDYLYPCQAPPEPVKTNKMSLASVVHLVRSFLNELEGSQSEAITEPLFQLVSKADFPRPRLSHSLGQTSIMCSSLTSQNMAILDKVK